MKNSRLKKTLIRKRRKNESFFKYAIGLLHLWLGLLSAFVIIVVCLSGCLYAFKNQFSDLLNWDKVFVKEKSALRKTPSEIREILLREKKELKSIIIPADKDRSYVVSYTCNNVDSAGYLNPYSGKDLGMADVSMNRFFEAILDIHRNLMMGNVGRQINGAAVLMFCLLFFQGLSYGFQKKSNTLSNP